MPSSAKQGYSSFRAIHQVRGSATGRCQKLEIDLNFVFFSEIFWRVIVLIINEMACRCLVWLQRGSQSNILVFLLEELLKYGNYMLSVILLKALSNLFCLVAWVKNHSRPVSRRVLQLLNILLELVDSIEEACINTTQVIVTEISALVVG